MEKKLLLESINIKQCITKLCVCVCNTHSGLNYLLTDRPAAVSEDVLMGKQRHTPLSAPIPSSRLRG